MTMPRPVRLFHITAIDNLEMICQQGALLSKTKSQQLGLLYNNIAHSGAQGARAVKTVTDPPGGLVHEFVPFYFAPRSPMLSAIHNGRVQNCNYDQTDIIYFETTPLMETLNRKGGRNDEKCSDGQCYTEDGEFYFGFPAKFAPSDCLQ